jgi:DNA-3-methyladenine glycosylase
VFTPLPREFYLPSAEIVAPLLLGHYLLRRTPQGLIGGLIVETEAYLYNDPACHAAVKQTARNRSMFGDCGRGYVYLIYGMHYCFNAVCCEEGRPEAVLIRALEPTFGPEIIQANRPNSRPRDLTNGPAKLCAALQIDRIFDEVDLCENDSSLFIAQNPERETLLTRYNPLVQTTRIGITKAADWPLRWYLSGSEFVSKR